MKRIIPILFLAFACSSCATILNKKYLKVDVHTSEPSRVILNRDTFHTAGNRVVLKLKRAKKDLKFKIETDSISKNIILPYKRSFAYYLNFPMTFGYGVVFDNFSPKRFTYSRSLYFDMIDSIPDFQVYDVARKGEIYWRLTLPFYNHFKYKTNEIAGEKITNGFWGIGTGLDYFYDKNKFLSFNISYATSFPRGAPSPYPQVTNLQRGRDFDSVRSVYFALTNNHKVKVFSLGYGMAYSKEKWEYLYDAIVDGGEFVLSTSGEKRKLGLLFSGYVQNGTRFNLGLTYHPTFYELEEGTFTKKYEHLISLEFAWRFRIKR